MSVLRAILGRFARFLVRIARTLDPGVAATPHWAMPERMAALRLRYPGAPEHWLEMLARRTTLGDAAPAPAYRPEAEPQRGSPQPHFDSARPATPPQPAATDPTRSAERPSPRFPGPAGTLRVVARLGGQAAAPSRPAREEQPAPSRQVRPMLTFGSPRVRNPIANLLRGKPRGERPEAPRFVIGDHPPPSNIPQPESPGRQARPEQPPEFPGTDQRSAHPVEWIGPREQATQERNSKTGWPEFRHSVPPGPSWPGESAKHARFNPRFAAPDNRWPELPPFVDESGRSVLRASDEAAIIAEQLGGTWSA